MNTLVRKILPAAIVLASVPVIAQEAMLEEVVVTARKRVESQQSVPVAVTTASGEELQKRGIVEFRDLQVANPNVRIEPGAGSAVATTIGIRGNLQNDTTTQLDAAVGVYLDGMIMARTFGVSTSMVDIQSVQTLKGPQGTLFGRNTTGGAMLLSTVDPEVGGDVSGYVRGEAGSEDILGVEAAVNLPLGDAAALRLVGAHRESGDFLKYNDGTELGARERDTLRAKLLWDVTDSTAVKFTAEYGDLEATLPSQVGVQPNNAKLSGLDNIAGEFPTPTIPGVSTGETIVTPQVATSEEQSVESDLYILDIAHETSWGEVKFITGYRELDVESLATLSPGAGYTQQDKPDLESFSAELQVNGLFWGDKLQLTSGLYYFDETTHEDQTTSSYQEIRDVISIFPEVLSRVIAKAETESVSAYLQASYALTDNANLTLGGRYTSDDKSMDGSSGQFGAPGTPLTYDEDNSESNYLVSFDYHITDDVMAYVKTSTGYRSGGASLAEDADRPGHWGQFEPEYVTNYEMGMKSEWMDNRLRLNLALFNQDYEDYQYTSIVPVEGVPTRLATSSDATIRGGEVELSALLPAGFTLDISYGYTDAEIEGGAADGDALPNIPENTYSVTLGKLFTTDIGDFDLRVIYDYRDELYSAVGAIEESITDDRELLNLSASYTSGPWSVVGYVNNALDEEYNNRVIYSAASPAAFGLFGLSFSTVNLPRTAGVRVGYEF